MSTQHENVTRCEPTTGRFWSRCQCGWQSDATFSTYAMSELDAAALHPAGASHAMRLVLGGQR